MTEKILKEEKFKEKILNELKKKELSTSSIATNLGMNYQFVLRLLEEMEKEKIVKSEITIKGRFWQIELKGGKLK